MPPPPPPQRMQRRSWRDACAGRCAVVEAPFQYNLGGADTLCARVGRLAALDLAMLSTLGILSRVSGPIDGQLSAGLPLAIVGSGASS